MLMGVRVYFLFNMKLIDSKVEYLLQENGIEGIYKMIEVAGRTAYQSLDKITDDSAKGFVDRMINSKHYAALEHGTVYLKVPYTDWIRDEHEWTYMFPEGLPWASVDSDGKYCYITTNYRHIEAKVGLNTMLKYLCEPTENHEKRYTFRFTCSRAIAQELTRHRVFSFLMESQRYVNYSKDKHGGEITFIKPCWYNDKKAAVIENPKTILEANIFSQDSKSYQFEKQLSSAEAAYFRLLNEGCQPQQARDVLPNATKTELIMTGFSSDWRYLVDLRLYGKTGKPHPDMLNLMEKLRYEALEAGIWYDIIKYPSKFE